MMTSIIIFLIGTLVARLLLELVLTVATVGPERRSAGQPTLGDIWKMSQVPLDLKSSARLPRYEIRAAIDTGGKAGLDRLIRQKFTGDYTDWSVDYRYRCFNHSGNPIPGRWTNPEGVSESKIWFYNRRTPAAPEPKPEPVPVPRPLTVDEEAERIAAFLKHPTAFWLNPDWNKARETGQPFWMHDPAPIPTRYLPVPDKIERAAEAIAHVGIDSGRLISYEVFAPSYDDPVMVLMTDDGQVLKYTPSEYRQAKRRAREIELELKSWG